MYRNAMGSIWESDKFLPLSLGQFEVKKFLVSFPQIRKSLYMSLFSFLISLPGSSNPKEEGIPLLIARETKREWKGTPEISEKSVGREDRLEQ